ncbi:glycine dehydrogenase [Candidatus Tenderia electrophaga]|jgi:glycine dehydrogenase subunit 1|uniref:Probable glycine dehydrogenase (decarboxylating) subunit 1 n=1 Tax=Candidatus Tenderia electrophaga TaxID=1748243 RepID=A0A0S2TA37_9GAMM|nr:glycine dehydrogenase [Candidatus Tenderia electrophaga]
MPFIPHTEHDVNEMLDAIGVASIEDLFDEIPAELRIGGLSDAIPAGLNEMDVARLMRQRAAGDAQGLSFIGAGAYEHHIPQAVWDIATRGEFYSAYTPYQAEASQGTLQVLYEYQTMMASLNGLDVSNASLYDGASALAEAVLMAVRAHRKSKAKRILMPSTVHPAYRAVVKTIVKNQGITIEELPYCSAAGKTLVEALKTFEGDDITALVIPQPNFFGVLEDVDALAGWAADNNSLAIGVVNPTALALLKPPGEWGEKGVDIACGEGQPLGIPLSSGGPYYGFMCCKQAHARQLPGRIIGRTVDLDGKPGFALTLQAREQHIRRSKATSNICTNQGLMVTASTIYMALMGAEGLERVAAQSMANSRALADKLCALNGVERVFSGTAFHDVVLRLPQPVDQVLAALADKGIFGGYPMGRCYAELNDCISVSATETKTDADLDAYAQALTDVLGA